MKQSLEGRTDARGLILQDSKESDLRYQRSTPPKSLPRHLSSKLQRASASHVSSALREPSARHDTRDHPCSHCGGSRCQIHLLYLDELAR
jgi:hypothetical protein